MDKRYQVFVSSTYEDLHEERREVMQTLLSLDCIPTGMELFPAADSDSWTHIQRFIGECDYYIVVVAGRYGSTGPAGKSYTEMEYDCAVQAGLPILAFLHKDPGQIPANRSESTDAGKTALSEFRKNIESARHAKYWSSASELAGTVALSMASIKTIKPRVGWVRADLIPDEALKDELLRVRREVDALNVELADAKSRAVPQGTEELAQGTERTTIVVDFSEGGRASYDCRWQDIIRSVLPQTFGAEAEERQIDGALASVAQDEGRRREGGPSNCWGIETVTRGSYGTVMNQMVALGLIEARPNPLSPTATMWFATPYGVREGSRLVAVKKAESVTF